MTGLRDDLVREWHDQHDTRLNDLSASIETHDDEIDHYVTAFRKRFDRIEAMLRERVTWAALREVHPGDMRQAIIDRHEAAAQTTDRRGGLSEESGGVGSSDRPAVDPVSAPPSSFEAAADAWEAPMGHLATARERGDALLAAARKEIAALRETIAAREVLIASVCLAHDATKARAEAAMRRRDVAEASERALYAEIATIQQERDEARKALAEADGLLTTWRDAFQQGDMHWGRPCATALECDQYRDTDAYLARRARERDHGVATT